MRIDASGNVGIGTDSPAAPLSIEGSSTGEYDALILRNGNAAASGQSTAIIFEASAGTSGDEASSVAKISGLRTGSGSTGDLLFHTTNAGVSTERMRIDASGNLMVGTPTSAGRFSVEHSSTSTPAGFFNNPNAGTSGVQAIGTSLPSTANNTNCYHLKSTTQGVASYFLYGDGSSSFTSDERQKKNIVTTRDGYLEDLKNLRVVDFHWNNQEDTEDKSIGLIAQEVEQVFPRLIVEHELEGAGVRKNLKGSDFTFILIKALQEAMDRIETLEAKVAALES